MKVLSVLLALALVASAGMFAPAMAQMPAAKEVPLKDGTKLVLKDDAKMQDLKEGATVVARYKAENGKNVVTSIDVQAPAAPSSDSEKKQ